jgi:prepilin-type N-terminal cleavage/methylation domain-containing protein
MVEKKTDNVRAVRMLRAVGGQKGFTLIEMIIVIVILGIIGGISFQVVAYGVEAFKKSSARKDLYDQGRLALERMAREIRDAKELVECSDNSITFNKQHPSLDSVEEIKFWLDDTNTLWRVRNPSTDPLSDRLASNVDSFQVANENCDSASGISVDAWDSGTADGTDGITILNYTVSGSNRLMLVGVSINNDSNETVTSVTYNGTDLTKVDDITNSDDARVEIWSLVAPDTGEHNVVITFSAALEQEAVAGVVTFNGVDQTTPLGTFASAQADDSTPATVSIPSDLGELVFGVVSAEYDAVTASSGQTEHWNTGFSSTYGAGGTAAGASPSVTMSWDLDVDATPDNHWAIGGVSIKPSTGSGGGSGPAGSVVSLELTLEDPNDSDNRVSMRTMVNMRNVP